MVRVEYRCADGTPFPVEFESEADAAARWRLDPEHTPRRLTPMADAVMRAGDVGARRAYEEVDMVRPAFFRPGPAANGFCYFSGDGDDESFASLVAGCVALVQRFGSALDVWRDYCLPLVREDCERSSSDAGLSLAEHADLAGHALQVTMLPAYICGNDLDRLGDAIKGHVEGDPRTAAAELVQGQPSPTLECDRKLWALGQTIAGDDALSSALRAKDPTAAFDGLRARGAHHDFFADLDAFLDEYGGLAEGWEISFPTWREMGTGFWGLLRTMARPGTLDPQQATDAAVARAETLTSKIEDALAGDAEALAKFRRRLERSRPYVTIREERAHWQLLSVGCLRAAVLRRGEALVASGVIDNADDALFLVPDEAERPGPHTGDLRPLVTRRRAEHEGWLQRTPPFTIGGDGAAADPVAAEAGASDAASTSDVDGEPILLRGIPGSRGAATGTVRVLRSLADADAFQAGDVLVCRMTSPPWTPLFGLAAAVVTDGGDSGSHSAIAAREYGIPCVVGTDSATTTLLDGQLVCVNGDTGTVSAA